MRILVLVLVATAGVRPVFVDYHSMHHVDRYGQSSPNAR